MVTTKEQDITELLNLSKMVFEHSPAYPAPSTTVRATFRTPSGLWLDILFDPEDKQYEVYLDRCKFTGAGNEDPANGIKTAICLDQFEAQCLVYDYWHRDADGNPPTEVT